jgi:hypothetical protein
MHIESFVNIPCTTAVKGAEGKDPKVKKLFLIKRV